MASYGADANRGNPNPNNPYDFNGVQVSHFDLSHDIYDPLTFLLSKK